MTDEHMEKLVCFDTDRVERIGLTEAILANVKTPEQISEALRQAHNSKGKALITRLEVEKFDALSEQDKALLDYDSISKTAISGKIPRPSNGANILIITGGTSDLCVAREAARTLLFHGVSCNELIDIGVAGLWRVLHNQEAIKAASILIVCAGMEGALFSVIGGLARGLVIAVATSNGYGVSEGGRVALESALSSCAPGIATTNIDNGYGAACIALRSISAS